MNPIISMTLNPTESPSKNPTNSPTGVDICDWDNTQTHTTSTIDGLYLYSQNSITGTHYQSVSLDPIKYLYFISGQWIIGQQLGSETNYDVVCNSGIYIQWITNPYATSENQSLAYINCRSSVVTNNTQNNTQSAPAKIHNAPNNDNELKTAPDFNSNNSYSNNYYIFIILFGVIGIMFFGCICIAGMLLFYYKNKKAYVNQQYQYQANNIDIIEKEVDNKNINVSNNNSKGEAILI
eukprot:205738_1